MTAENDTMTLEQARALAREIKRRSYISYRGADVEELCDLILSDTLAREIENAAWRPISEAPSYTGFTFVHVHGGRYKTGELIASDGDYWRDNENLSAIPTHWRPQLSFQPPAQQKAREAGR